MRRFLCFSAFGISAFCFVLIVVCPVAQLSIERTFLENGAIKFENYDIREINAAERQTLVKSDGLSSDELNTIRKTIRRASEEFETSTLGTSAELNKVSGLVEIVSASTQGKGLAAGSDESRVGKLRGFIAANPQLFGDLSASQLNTVYDYTNPDGGLGFAALSQQIGGVAVFQGELKGVFDRRGELVRVINNLAPGTASAPYLEVFGTPADAVSHAVSFLGIEAKSFEPRIEHYEPTGTVVFERGRLADRATAQRVYFPAEPGLIVPAWKVLIWLDSSAYYVIVDARHGTLLWRKSITENQSVGSSFSVYRSSAAGLMQTADSPSPFTPGCVTPIACTQPPLIARTAAGLIGNEPPNQFNNIGWIPDTGLPVRTPANPNITDGNNVEAGIDRDGMPGVDADGWAFGNPARVFNFDYNPGPGNPPPGEEPVPPNPQPYPPTRYQQGVITHAFYTANRFHDATYRLGFIEAAGNFQHFNFGRGGAEGDRLSFEIQDSSGTNGANFSVPADGVRPRLQMMIWTGPTPDRDGALDSQMVVHELAHGISGRLHGNSSGLNSNMARGMGEGWSDFFAFAMLSEPANNRLGVNALAGYISYNVVPGFEGNYYYGLRRFPTAVWEATGEGGCRHNPLTFADIDSTQYNVSNGCFPRGPIGSTAVDQIHNLGEVWSAILWEVRDKLAQRHGPAEGNRRSLQYVMDGMKLSPLNPTMTQSRDAIIFAASAIDPADAAAVWAGFAVRGLGFGAAIVSAGSGTGNTRVFESYDLPNLNVIEPFSVSDSVGNNNGYPEMGENLLITVTLTNTTGAAISDVSASLQNGGTASFGTVANGQIVSRQLTYFLPVYGTCDNRHSVTINVSGSAGSFSTTRQFRFGPPAPTFANNAPINIPASGVAAPYPSIISSAGLSGGVRVSVELNGFSHSFPNDVDILLQGPSGASMVVMSDVGGSTPLTSPINITLSDAASALLSETSIAVSGQYRPTNVGTVDTFPGPAPTSPTGIPAPSGTATFTSIFSGILPVNGEWKLFVVDDAGGDAGTISGGWKLILDPIVCIDVFPSNVHADFDGDRKTDISVFRPADSNWYLNRSSAGFAAVNWGLSTDTPVPHDFDGDHKADIAVFRPAADAAMADFYIIRSSNSTFSYISWGLPGDVPAVDDFDRDGRADVGIFRPSTRMFWFLRSSNSSVFRSRPVPSMRAFTGDFDGDGTPDFVSYAGGQWFVLNSTTDYQSGITFSWGLEGDKTVAADYDGDGVTDAAVYRPSDGVWYIRKSSGGASYIRFGNATDIPVPGDYDGDGRSDAAVFRDGTWYINRSTSGVDIVQFGLAGDKPLAGLFVH